MPRILYITPLLPQPGYGGGERILSTINALQSFAQVDTLLLHAPFVPQPVVPPNTYTIEIIPGSHPTRLQMWQRNLLLQDFRPDPRLAAFTAALHQKNHYDAFFCNYYYSLLAGSCNLGPSYMDLPDIPTDIHHYRLPGMNTLARSLFKKSLKPFRAVFVTKKSDAPKTAHPNAVILPVISTQYASAHAGQGFIPTTPTLLFVGTFSWQPNLDAMLWFLNHCLPRIRQRYPDVLLRVAGNHGDRLPKTPNVEILGFVPDLAAEYRRAAVIICPTATPSGANVKVAEATSFGRPVVATTLAAEGFEGVLFPERDLLIGDTPEQFADQCLRLFDDPNLRESLAAASIDKLTQSTITRIISETLAPAFPAPQPKIPIPSF